MRVLVVEDDREIAGFLASHLPRAGFAVDTAYTGASALSLVRVNDYDIIILDLHLPDMGGEQVCLEVRRKKRVPPMLVLTVVSDVPSKVRLLTIGADDYLPKPFSFVELVARMRALLRRPTETAKDSIVAGDLEMDISGHSVTRGGESIPLTRKEFAILEYILRHRGMLVSKMSLVEHVWDASADPLSSSIETHMSNLRKKLGEPGIIHTLHGRGYRID